MTKPRYEAVLSGCSYAVYRDGFFQGYMSYRQFIALRDGGAA